MAKYSPSYNLEGSEHWERIKDLKTINNILTIVTQGLTKFSITEGINHELRFTANRERKGEVYTDGRINFLGVRNDLCNDKFNDSLYVYWVATNTLTSEKEFICYKANNFTTKPGYASFCGRNNTWNSNGGVAIVCEGWHKDMWIRGLHNGYPALRQRREDDTKSPATAPINIYRDRTNYIYNSKSQYYNVFRKTKVPFFLEYSEYSTYNLGKSKESTVTRDIVKDVGINLHRSYGATEYKLDKSNVGSWSAGCQVFKNPYHFNDLMNNVIYRNESKSKQEKFSYFLTNQKVFDLLDNQIDDYIENSPLSFDFREIIPEEHHPYKIDDYHLDLPFNIYEKCGVVRIGSSEWLIIHMMGRIPSGPAKYFGR
jgi:hypothetical protein